MRYQSQKKPDREAVAKSLRDLEKLFGKSKPQNENARLESGAGDTAGKPFKQHGGEL